MSTWKCPPVRTEFIDALQRAVILARTNKEWVVVVCPNKSEAITFFDVYAGVMFPRGSTYSGRTALLDGGGRLSVVSSEEDSFIPSDVPYAVMFLGWEDDLAADNRKMQLWRDRATRVLG